MTTIPPLPNRENRNWLAWAQGVDQAARAAVQTDEVTEAIEAALAGLPPAAQVTDAAVAGVLAGPESAAIIQGRVQAAIDKLVTGAPGTLDTLAELAAALGDDANFAATVTAALAARATLVGGKVPDTQLPDRLQDAALRAEFDPAGAAAAAVTPAAVAASLPARLADTALKAAFVPADPVLSAFVYDGSGNLISYAENGITITLTYNADGTVATQQRGAGPARAFTYSGGNLAGVA